MKKLLLLLVLIPNLLSAQDIYSDMLADGKTWSFIRFPNGYTMCMGMRGDTIVNGMECRKYGYVNDDGTFSCTSVFRQEGDKVYVKYHNRQDFSLAYDFGVSVGDTMEMGLDWARIVVTGKDVVTARGHEMRRVSYKVTEYYDGIEWRPLEDNYGSWIEGIGGSSGPESHIPVPGFGGNYYMMTDISLGDEVLCDAYIFTGQDPEKMMLTFKPEWTYTKQLWDEVKSDWGEPVEGHAMKNGMEIPSPWFFPYTTISIEEEGGSKILLRKTVELIESKGYQVGNIDATICAERPKLNPFIPQMQQCMADVIGIDAEDISIKATTTEKLGFTGREEGMSAYAVVLIQKD